MEEKVYPDWLNCRSFSRMSEFLADAQERSTILKVVHRRVINRLDTSLIVCSLIFTKVKKIDQKNRAKHSEEIIDTILHG